MLDFNVLLLCHIKEEIDFVLTHTNEKLQDEVMEDAVLCRAIIRSIEIIGEASKKIEEDFKSDHPEIEWKKMARTRDRVIHRDRLVFCVNRNLFYCTRSLVFSNSRETD